jgi:hypothetical protein
MIEIPVSYTLILEDQPRELAQAFLASPRIRGRGAEYRRPGHKDFHLPIYPFPPFGGCRSTCSRNTIEGERHGMDHRKEKPS